MAAHQDDVFIIQEEGMSDLNEYHTNDTGDYNMDLMEEDGEEIQDMPQQQVNLSKYGTTFQVDERPQSRSLEHAIELHNIAATNLILIWKHVRSMAKPSLSELYNSNATAPCAPPDRGLEVLFKHFNEIAKANFVAHPSLSRVANEVIFFYGMDSGHSFNKGLDVTHFNLVVAVFKWASIL